MHTFTCDPDYVVQKLAMVALTRVLVDILPSYRIRLPTEVSIV